VRADSEILDPYGRYLANIPIALHTVAADPASRPALTPARIALGVAWAAAAIAAAAAGLTLRTTLALAERRRRFASAVTHELRTPLTTFRLYTELLQRGVVHDPEQRRQYLETLQHESGRLSTLVENVLAHARLEQGQGSLRLERTTFDALMKRLAPSLDRCAVAAGVVLEPGVLRTEPSDGAADGMPGGEITLDVDPDAIDRVLCNLIDNAGKYARNGAAPTVRIEAALTAGSLVIGVRDRGPGIQRDRVKTVFEPFDRGGRDAADPVPGIGLGLALSRDLARDMGGDLTLEPPGAGGACFRLELPTRSRR